MYSSRSCRVAFLAIYAKFATDKKAYIKPIAILLTLRKQIYASRFIFFSKKEVDNEVCIQKDSFHFDIMYLVRSSFKSMIEGSTF